MFTPPNVSRVTCHVSCATCHVSHVTCHIFFLLTKWWSLSGEGLSSTELPRLVFLLVSLRGCYKGFVLFDKSWAFSSCFDPWVVFGHMTFKLGVHVLPGFSYIYSLAIFAWNLVSNIVFPTMPAQVFVQPFFLHPSLVYWDLTLPMCRASCPVHFPMESPGWTVGHAKKMSTTIKYTGVGFSHS